MSGRGMGRSGGAAATMAATAALLLPLSACAPQDWGTPVWSQSSRATVPGDSLTIRRVVAGTGDVPVAPLLPEPGDVWPREEAPRATLMNPDEALRGVPPYTPPDGEPRLDREPPPGSTTPGSPRRRTRGSSTPPAPLPQPEADFRMPAQPPALPVTPPPPRTDGRVIPYPGGNAVTTGGTERFQTFNPPGTAGGGVAFPNGATTTLIEPDGRVRVVPTPPPQPQR